MKELTLLCTFCSGHLGHKVDSRGLPISPHLAGAPLPLPPVPAPFWLPPWLFLYNPLPKVLALLAPFFLFQSLVCPLALDGSHLCLPIPPAWTPLGVCLTHPCDPPVPGMHLAFCAVARLSRPGGPRGLPSACRGSIWGADSPRLDQALAQMQRWQLPQSRPRAAPRLWGLGTSVCGLDREHSFRGGCAGLPGGPPEGQLYSGHGGARKQERLSPSCLPTGGSSEAGGAVRQDSGPQDWLLPTRARSALDTTLWQPLLRLGWAWEGTEQTQALLGCLPSRLLLPLPPSGLLWVPYRLSLLSSYLRPLGAASSRPFWARLAVVTFSSVLLFEPHLVPRLGTTPVAAQWGRGHI